MDLIEILNNFAANHQWVMWIVVGYLSLHTAIKSIRDAIDTTPATDDNWFEKTATIMGKIAAYLIGFRAKK